jgi:ribosomal protein S18 acetylase RimI-like enzyme
MYIYSTLENTSVQTLYLAYLQAFEGFPSTKNVSIESFQNMLQIRGYIPEISMGTFEKSSHNLVGFILNGFRTWNGKNTVYDIVSGTLPSYRRQGIADTMFKNLRSYFKQINAEQYLTEVKKENTTAIELYNKQGFEIRRGLSSFRLNKENHHNPVYTCKIEYYTEVKQNEWERFETFWEFQPSWQNSISSLHAGKGFMIYALVLLENNIIGYGVIDKNTGDIPQLAVHKDHRRNGIAESIVSALFEKAAMNQLSIYNVDDAYDGMRLFLLKLGFINTINQYEIVLTL